MQKKKKKKKKKKKFHSVPVFAHLEPTLRTFSHLVDTRMILRAPVCTLGNRRHSNSMMIRTCVLCATQRLIVCHEKNPSHVVANTGSQPNVLPTAAQLYQVPVLQYTYATQLVVSSTIVWRRRSIIPTTIVGLPL